MILGQLQEVLFLKNYQLGIFSGVNVCRVIGIVQEGHFAKHLALAERGHMEAFSVGQPERDFDLALGN